MAPYILISIIALLIILLAVFFVSGKKKEIMKNINLVQFIIGIIGIGVIATSQFRRLK